MTFKVLPFEAINGSSPRAWTILACQQLRALSVFGPEQSREAAVDLIRLIYRHIPADYAQVASEVPVIVRPEGVSATMIDGLWTTAASCAYLVAILSAEDGPGSTWPIQAYQAAVRYLRRLFTVDECNALLDLLDLQMVAPGDLEAALPDLPVREL